MTSIRKLAGLGVVGAGLALASAGPSQAAEAGAAGLATTATSAAARAYPGEAFTQYYGRRYGGGYGYRGRRGYGGGAVAAGVIGGLAVGALAAGAIAGSGPAYGYGPGYYGPGPGVPVAGPGVPVGNIYGADPHWVNYCASRYRSFDPRSGTYLASDGYRYPCQ